MITSGDRREVGWVETTLNDHYVLLGRGWGSEEYPERTARTRHQIQ